MSPTTNASFQWHFGAPRISYKRATLFPGSQIFEDISEMYLLCMLLCFALVSQTFGALIENGWLCYDDWSRCSPVTNWLGFLWKNCNDRCKELGKSGGECRDSPSKGCPNLLPNNKQCYCYWAPEEETRAITGWRQHSKENCLKKYLQKVYCFLTFNLKFALKFFNSRKLSDFPRNKELLPIFILQSFNFL